MYSYIKHRIKHSARFRHKRGFGVHSPFMFNLILNVIRDKKKRYSDIKLPEAAGRLSRHKRRMYRLVCRLVCHLEVKNVLCLGDDAELLSACLSGLPVVSGVIINKPEQFAGADFIYIGKDAFGSPQAVESAPVTLSGDPTKCLFVTNIHKARQNTLYWNLLKQQANVSVDMMWYGILFFDNKLQKGRYNLII